MLRKTLILSVLVFVTAFSAGCGAQEEVQQVSQNNENAMNSEVPMQVKASHILVPTKEEAESLKAKIASGESFEDLAKQHSKCPSGKEGGDLGFFGRGQMVPEFETAAFTTEPGKVSDPVQTQFGWHLIKVVDKK